eukprot:353355-Alexandrium_andersonii.AAC.1
MVKGSARDDDRKRQNAGLASHVCVCVCAWVHAMCTEAARWSIDTGQRLPRQSGAHRRMRAVMGSMHSCLPQFVSLCIAA